MLRGFRVLARRFSHADVRNALIGRLSESREQEISSQVFERYQIEDWKAAAQLHSSQTQQYLRQDRKSRSIDRGDSTWGSRSSRHQQNQWTSALFHLSNHHLAQHFLVKEPRASAM